MIPINVLKLTPGAENSLFIKIFIIILLLLCSGWWFNDCFAANLNGQYDANCKTSSNGGGIIWMPWEGNKVSLKYAQMMIRRNS